MLTIHNGLHLRNDVDRFFVKRKRMKNININTGEYVELVIKSVKKYIQNNTKMEVTRWKLQSENTLTRQSQQRHEQQKK